MGGRGVACSSHPSCAPTINSQGTYDLVTSQAKLVDHKTNPAIKIMEIIVGQHEMVRHRVETTVLTFSTEERLLGKVALRSVIN